MISTDQIAIGVAVDKTLIDTISSKGRNFTSFVQLAPGISTQPRTDNAGTWSAGSHHTIGGIDYVAGGGGNNGFYVNGVNANDNWVGGQSYSPSLEAVDEIKVDVANFSAANGRDLSSLSVTTRAGTNAFHGSVFDYFEDEALNAWDPLDKQRVAAGTEKPTLARHQFGGNLGGPVFRNKAVLLRQLRADLQQARRRAVVPARADRGGTAGRLQRAAPALPGRSELRALQPLHDRHHRRRARASASRSRTTTCAAITRPDGSPAIDPRSLDMLNLFPLPNYTDPDGPEQPAELPGVQHQQVHGRTASTRASTSPSARTTTCT